jgi:hypothetical protein
VREIARRNLLRVTTAIGITTLIRPLKVSAVSAVSYKVQSIDSTSFTLHISSASTGKAYIEYGYSKSKYESKTTITQIVKGMTSIKVNQLRPDSKIYFRLRYLLGNRTSYSALTQANITTTKASADYVFAVQADPHMDENSSAEVYTQTLEQIVKASPVFLMDLGDIFMTDKLPNKTEANIRARYELMKGFYDKLNGVPFYITLGNHDGELGYSNFNTKGYRKEYFPQQTGELAYYSFTGPDSLHISLDIFTYTMENPKDDGWQWSLGKTQYDWLKKTLENSKTSHKFVYVHHLLFGNAQSRGGVEIAKFNEWGGLNRDGTPGFESKRPGWGKPVHQLLVENGVDIVFKGHDHLYVKQELDGIIYQTLPQPSHPGDKVNSAIEYGYVTGKVVGGSGFLKVTTSKSGIKVDFVRHDGVVLDSYVRNS